MSAERGRERHVAPRIGRLAGGDGRDLEALEREQREVDTLSDAERAVRQRAAEALRIDRERGDGDEAEDRRELADRDEVHELRARLHAEPVDRAERHDRQDPEGLAEGPRRDPEQIEEQGRVRGPGDERRGPTEPPDDEADLLTEGVPGEHVRAARLREAAGELGEAERDGQEQQRARDVRERRVAAHRALHVVGQREDAGADGRVDPDAEHVEQREAARELGAPCGARCGGAHRRGAFACSVAGRSARPSAGMPRCARSSPRVIASAAS